MNSSAKIIKLPEADNQNTEKVPYIPPSFADKMKKDPELIKEMAGDKIELISNQREKLEGYKREKKLSEQVITDELTGLYNRRYYVQEMAQKILLAKRHDTNFSLISFDIDHFKNVNDTYGHDNGDVVLKKLAELLKKGREGDMVFRTGGEEFIKVLPETDANNAHQVAENLRSAVEEADLGQYIELRKGQSKPKITISIGYTDYESTKKGIEKAVDDALYLAKTSGRNRVEKWEEDIDLKREITENYKQLRKLDIKYNRVLLNKTVAEASSHPNKEEVVQGLDKILNELQGKIEDRKKKAKDFDIMAKELNLGDNYLDQFKEVA